MHGSYRPHTAAIGSFSIGVVQLALVLSTLAVFVIGGSSFWFREHILRLLQRNETFRTLSYIAEPVLTFAAGAMATATEVFKASTWYSPQPTLEAALPLILGVMTAAISLKVLSALAKDGKKQKIRELEAELEAGRRQLISITESRKSSIRTLNQVREILNEKLTRLREAVRSEPFTIDEYLEAISPAQQLQFIVTMIHDFFESQLDTGKSLRVAVYLRDPPDSYELSPAFSWDGKKADCIKENNGPYMRDDPEGAKSLIVQTFQDPGVLQVVTSTHRAAQAGAFYFFRPEQRAYLKSLVAYKHVGERDARTGTRDALIVCLDTDQEGFFGQFDKERLLEFFVEMMKRFEYEHLSLTAQAGLKRIE